MKKHFTITLFCFWSFNCFGMDSAPPFILYGIEGSKRNSVGPRNSAYDLLIREHRDSYKNPLNYWTNYLERKIKLLWLPEAAQIGGYDQNVITRVFADLVIELDNKIIEANPLLAPVKAYPDDFVSKITDWYQEYLTENFLPPLKEKYLNQEAYVDQFFDCDQLGGAFARYDGTSLKRESEKIELKEGTMVTALQSLEYGLGAVNIEWEVRYLGSGRQGSYKFTLHERKILTRAFLQLINRLKTTLVSELEHAITLPAHELTYAILMPLSTYYKDTFKNILSQHRLASVTEMAQELGIKPRDIAKECVVKKPRYVKAERYALLLQVDSGLIDERQNDDY